MARHHVGVHRVWFGRELMAFRFMMKFEPTRLVLVRMPFWRALAYDLGPEWLCGALRHRFCCNKIFAWIDSAFDRYPQFEIQLLEDLQPNQLKTFLGWPTWDDEDAAP